MDLVYCLKARWEGILEEIDKFEKANSMRQVKYSRCEESGISPKSANMLRDRDVTKRSLATQTAVI